MGLERPRWGSRSSRDWSCRGQMINPLGVVPHPPLAKGSSVEDPLHLTGRRLIKAFGAAHQRGGLW